MRQIKAGDIVTFLPAWRNEGDNGDIRFRALENEDGGRVLIVAEIGLPINPTEVVWVEWIETINGAKEETI